MDIFSLPSSFPLQMLVMICLFIAYSTTAFTNLSTDAMALLTFKTRLFGEFSSLNWSYTNLVCNWTGVTCGSRHVRVVGLDLSDMGLQGTLPPEIGNLSFLISLDMSGNNFNGNIPQEWFRLRRLRFMNLSENYLSGEIPPWIGLLSELRSLTLYNNSFNGFLPYSIGNASKLEILILFNNEIGGALPTSIFNLSNLQLLSIELNSFKGILPSYLCSGIPNIVFLMLGDNQLEGEIPSNISACTQLERISMYRNNFVGSIPSDMSSPLTPLWEIHLAFNGLIGELPITLGEWKALEIFSIEANNITGTIPIGISNLTNLLRIEFRNNKLSGTIPNVFGTLHKLEGFGANSNNLWGEIPSGFFNISSLQFLSIANNKLSGQLPIDFCIRLHNLTTLVLAVNELSGELPPYISNCSSLQLVDFSYNFFTGTIPSTIGEMRFLSIVNLQANNFSSESSRMSFLSAMTNCKHLSALWLSSNPFIASLPNTMGNLSTSLEYFACAGCGIYGVIPIGFGNLTSLLSLDLSLNNLVGSIPITFDKLQNLQGLYLQSNNISGYIPNALCKLRSAGYIGLHGNQIGGSIPTCIGNLSTLRELWISNNNLQSTIPLDLWQLSDLLELNLSNNHLRGSIASDIGNLNNVYLVDLSLNNFGGVIPTSIGDMHSLINFSLAFNEFEGMIPESFGTILSLERLNLSHNNLSGRIPRALQEISCLVVFDVSFNNLSGAIPTEGPFRNFSYKFFESNKELCGEPQFGVPPCKVLMHGFQRRKVILSLTVVLAVVMGFSITLFVGYILNKSRQRHASPNEEKQTSTTLPVRVSYPAILQATDNLNEAYLLGNGAFGSVFKGVLLDGQVVAIKVFNLQNDRALKSFDVECSILQNLRHRNLCKVISACSNSDIKAIVMEYLPNGSLEGWLHGENFFDIFQRFSIMIDIACALEYLHQDYDIPIVHCDVKPSNILLDEDMTAYLSDFGIAKLLHDMDNTVQTTTFATMGYIAPEYGSEGLVSTKCDVFSFGIVLMEVFSGKRPSDEELMGELTLRNLTMKSMSTRIIQVTDPRMLNLNEANFAFKLYCVSLVMELALKCTMESPIDRPTMREVVVTLKDVSRKLLNSSRRRR